jgi:hypothetical protein
MARPLPAQAQAGNGEAHAGSRDGEMMNLSQIVAQQRSRPHSGAVPQRARVAVDHLQDQRINDPMYSAGTTATLAWGKSGSHAEVLRIRKWATHL